MAAVLKGRTSYEPTSRCIRVELSVRAARAAKVAVMPVRIASCVRWVVAKREVEGIVWYT